MPSIKFFFPVIANRLKLVLLFVCFKENSILVTHCALDREKVMHLLLGEHFKVVGLVLYLGGFFLLCLLDLELLLSGLLRLLALFLFPWSCRSGLFFLRNLGLLGPLLDKWAVAEGNQSVLSKLELELDSEVLLLRVLGLSQKVANVLIKPSNCGFVLD